MIIKWDFLIPLFLCIFVLFQKFNMVSINQLQIDQLAKQIDINISTDLGNIFTKVYAWKAEDFKDYSKAIDLSFLLEGTSETESFTVFPVEHLWTETITGLWFFEFETDGEVSTDSCSINSNVAIGVAANYTPYFDAVTDALLSLNINGCKPEVLSSSEDCAECAQGAANVYYLNALLTSLKYATQNGYYEEATKIVAKLDDILEVCHTCPSYTDTLLINGLGFATINNAITSTFI